MHDSNEDDKILDFVQISLKNVRSYSADEDNSGPVGMIKVHDSNEDDKLLDFVQITLKNVPFKFS